jgi:hypothetical protein
MTKTHNRYRKLTKALALCSAFARNIYSSWVIRPHGCIICAPHPPIPSICKWGHLLLNSDGAGVGRCGGQLVSHSRARGGDPW